MLALPTPITRLLLLGLSLWMTTCANAAQLARAPFLQLVGPSSATVVFRTDKPCAAQVRFGSNGQLSATAPDPNPTRDHAIRLDSLSPATRYTYAVDACGAAFSAPKSFVTAPEPGSRRVHFAAMGDFGTGREAQAQVVASILKNEPELLLGLGDIAYDRGSESDMQAHLFAPMAPLLAEVPLFAAPGNHEYLSDQAQPYLADLYLPSNNPAHSELYYSFDWGPAHIVSLDSMCALGEATKDRCDREAMRAWTEQDLKQSHAPWKIVFFHHPFWSTGEHGSTWDMRAVYAPIFEAQGVDLVLTGHDHDYERSKPMLGDTVAPPGTRGITYLVVGSGGATTRPFDRPQPSWSVVRSASIYGYLDVVIDGETLTARLIMPNGAVFDSFTLTKPVAQAAPAPGTAARPNAEPRSAQPR